MKTIKLYSILFFLIIYSLEVVHVSHIDIPALFSRESQNQNIVVSLVIDKHLVKNTPVMFLSLILTSNSLKIKTIST